MLLYSFQKRIYELLAANASITEKAGIYDYVPEDKPLPFIVIGDDEVTEFKSKTYYGWEITTTINVWSDKRGSLVTKEIVGLIVDSLSVDTLVEDLTWSQLLQAETEWLDLEEGGYAFKFHRMDRMEVVKETPELIRGTIALTYRVGE